MWSMCLLFIVVIVVKTSIGNTSIFLVQSIQITTALQRTTRQQQTTTIESTHHLVPTIEDIAPALIIHASLSTSRQPTSNGCNNSPHENEISRRRLLTTSFINSFLISVVVSPVEEVYALQPRNEVMCNTGLFEHFLEYKCTPIGDIEDEGISKELTINEEQTTNSLLSKLGIENNNDTNTKGSTLSSKFDEQNTEDSTFSNSRQIQEN